MEHIIVKELASGYLLLTPEAGFRLRHKASGAFYSEAVVKPADKDLFQAVEGL